MNYKAEKYEEVVENFIWISDKMGLRESFKVHIFYATLTKLKENMGAYSEEQGGRFHQDILYFERRYKESYNENKTGDYIWWLIRESNLP